MTDKTTELTLSALLTQRCVAFANGPKAIEIVDSGIEDLFKNLVSDAFGSYSDFGKVMKEAMKAALPTNVENIIKLDHYNSLVTRLMHEKWAAAGIETSIVDKMTEMVTEFTSDKAIPKFIMASDLWREFIEDNKENACENQWERPQAIIDDSDDDRHIWVGLHPKPASESRYSSSTKTKSYECDFRLALSLQTEGGYGSPALLHEGHRVYELYAGQTDGGTLGKKIIKAYSRFDKLVMALYYGGSLLVWDEAPEDLYYPGCD